VRGVAFSPDGKRIVTGSEDNTLKVWDASNSQAEGEVLRGRGDLHAARGDFEQAIADYSAAIRLNPADYGALVARGRLSGQLAKWREALADLDRAIALDPSDNWTWFRSAPLRAQSGDMAGYHRFCRDFLSRFGQTDDPCIAERTAKICLLVPDAVEDLKAPARLAQQAAAASTHPFLSWFELAKGMAEYREGQFASAIEWLRKSQARAGARRDLLATDYLFIAMAHYRLGEQDQARKSFAEARRILESLPPANGSSDWGADWHDLLMCRIVQAEAKSLFAESGHVVPVGKPAPATMPAEDPFGSPANSNSVPSTPEPAQRPRQ
jgi:tetratricopeptide (TPR) repeat protein